MGRKLTGGAGCDLGAFRIDGLDGGRQPLIDEFLPVDGAGGILACFGLGCGQVQTLDAFLVGLKLSLKLPLDLGGCCHSVFGLVAIDDLNKLVDPFEWDALEASFSQGSADCFVDLDGSDVIGDDSRTQAQGRFLVHGLSRIGQARGSWTSWVASPHTITI